MSTDDNRFAPARDCVVWLSDIVAPSHDNLIMQQIRISISALGRVLLALFAALLLPSTAHGEVTLPAADSVEGYVCRLLINEVTFPGERGYTSEADTILAMEGLLRVLDARLKHIPPGYTQQQIAAVRTGDIIDIITAGGEKGQFDGFYRDASGTPVTVPRITERIDKLIEISGRGQPGKFARLLERAAALARDYTFGSLSSCRDPHKDVRVVNGVPASGRAYGWMTDEPQYSPGGNFLRIPDDREGSLGGNRFFTLRKDPR
jgi:hypothetical protein